MPAAARRGMVDFVRPMHHLDTAERLMALTPFVSRSSSPSDSPYSRKIVGCVHPAHS
jgi:hypothetical protein